MFHIQNIGNIVKLICMFMWHRRFLVHVGLYVICDWRTNSA